MAEDIDPQNLKTITNVLIEAISSRPFVAAMKQLKETPVAKRLDVAAKVLTPTALAAAGVKLPQGMRVTSRYFEPGSPELIEASDRGVVIGRADSLTGLGALGAWGCACGGGLTVCGGAGGGTD